MSKQNAESGTNSGLDGGAALKASGAQGNIWRDGHRAVRSVTTLLGGVAHPLRLGLDSPVTQSQWKVGEKRDAITVLAMALTHTDAVLVAYEERDRSKNSLGLLNGKTTRTQLFPPSSFSSAILADSEQVA